MTRASRRAILAFCATAALFGAGVGGGTAQAAFGDLSFANCIVGETFSDPLCSGNLDLNGFPRSLVISPDGTSAYSANRASSMISQYDRDPSTGKLTFKTCWQDTGGVLCGKLADGLAGVTGLAISPDGGSLYAAANSDDALVYFSRDTSSGDLSAPECVEDEDTGTSSCGATAKALDGAYAVTVSPDNASIYVASATDRAVAHFDRASDPGSLFFGIPLQDASDPCDDSAGIEDGCVHSVPLMSQPTEIAVTPDGANVYVADDGLSGVVAFDRATSSGGGDLTYDSCVADGPAPTCGGAAEAVPSLKGVDSITLGPDGSSLYAASMHDDGVVPFTILPGGQLQRTGPCFSDVDAPAEGCTRIDGLGQGLNSGPTGPNAVAITPDGRSAYVASGDSIVDSDQALSMFGRNPSTGALAYRGCIRDTTDGIPGCGKSFGLLKDVNGVVAESNSLVYAVGGDNSIVTFRRDLSVPHSPTGQTPVQTPVETPVQTPVQRSPAPATQKKKCKKRKKRKHKRAASAKKKHKKKCKRKHKKRRRSA